MERVKGDVSSVDKWCFVWCSGKWGESKEGISVVNVVYWVFSVPCCERDIG